ncbi:expressed protein [Phakopsora pachyrhizi]|uniref:Expressed protein n=1 Tax=Phakopsora pachyrhizi TaxID=170000 RepID=A0AAV0AS49_PHAPC|nr:expressed protein [Phakopsora pachyrhizi]
MFPVFVLQRNLWLGILISRLIQSTPLQTIEGIEKGLSINQRNSKVKSEVQAAIVSKQAKDWQYAKQLKGEIPFENLDTADLKAHLTEPSFQKEIKGRSRAEHTSLASLLNNEKSFQEVRKTKCSSETEKTVISGVSEFSAAQDSSEVDAQVSLKHRLDI